MNLFKEKNIAVFGLGKAGLGAVNKLIENGAIVFAWDDNESSRGAVELNATTLSEPSSWPWKHIEYLILSPGIPYTHNPYPIIELAKSSGCKIICDIELLYLSSPESIFVGITGTNGKSTTTALLYHICKGAGLKVEVGGNIGVAASSLPVLGEGGVYIMEMSSYQLDLLDKTKFNIAILLNITPDHIDRHGSMDGYIEAKKKIFDRQSDNDTAIIATDDENTKAIFSGLKAMKTISVSGADGVGVGELETLPGKHNRQNIAAAYAAAKELGIKSSETIKNIRSFSGLEHRLQYLGEIDGVKFINDSKATNAEATSNALDSFKNIYWIAGGIEKEGGITSLEKYFPNISRAFFIGSAANNFAKTVDGKIEYKKCGTLEEAFKSAVEYAHQDSNSVILLSPAAASFDQFKNFEERGNFFCELVKNLRKKKKAS